MLAQPHGYDNTKGAMTGQRGLAMHHALVRALLDEGEPVELAFAGDSMLPLITGVSDRIVLEPLAPDETPRVGEVYLFQTKEDRFVVHRLLKVAKDSDGSPYIFRGDHNYASERVARPDILARLVEVRRADGSVLRTNSTEWQRRSRRVCRRRKLINWVKYTLSSEGCTHLRPYYFIALIILMWAPLNGFGVPLNDFVFGIRLDHLIHASVYLPCAFYIYGFTRYRCRSAFFASLLLSVLVGFTTETVQYLLLYRGFDINDMAANCLGVTLGWLVCFVVYRKRHKVNS